MKGGSSAIGKGELTLKKTKNRGSSKSGPRDRGPQVEGGPSGEKNWFKPWGKKGNTRGARKEGENIFHSRVSRNSRQGGRSSSRGDVKRAVRLQKDKWDAALGGGGKRYSKMIVRKT